MEAAQSLLGAYSDTTNGSHCRCIWTRRTSPWLVLLFGGKDSISFFGDLYSGKKHFPLQLEEIVKVLGMADEDDCRVEMFVMIEWAGRSFGIPLAQLKGIEVDPESEEAIADWHYWLARGYLLCG